MIKDGLIYFALESEQLTEKIIKNEYTWEEAQDYLNITKSDFTSSDWQKLQNFWSDLED